MYSGRRHSLATTIKPKLPNVPPKPSTPVWSLACLVREWESKPMDFPVLREVHGLHRLRDILRILSGLGFGNWGSVLGLWCLAGLI